MKITRIETDLLRVPLPRAVSLPASQDPKAAKHVEVVLVHVLADGKPSGLGFTYALVFSLMGITAEYTTYVGVGQPLWMAIGLVGARMITPGR